MELPSFEQDRNCGVNWKITFYATGETLHWNMHNTIQYNTIQYNTIHLRNVRNERDAINIILGMRFRSICQHISIQENLTSRTPLANICWMNYSKKSGPEVYFFWVKVWYWREGKTRGRLAGFSRSPETLSNTFLYILSIVLKGLLQPIRSSNSLKCFQTAWYHWLHVWGILVFIVVFVVSHFDHSACFGTSFHCWRLFS